MVAPGTQLLLVDSDPRIVRALSDALANEGVRWRCVSGAGAALAMLESATFDALLLCVGRSDSSAEELLRSVLRVAPEVPVILVCAEHDVSDAIRLVQAGASDYLRVPFVAEEAIFVLGRALHAARYAERRSRPAVERIEMASDSPEMGEAIAMAERAARSLTTILIRGESGVGKEVLARYIHDRSPRAHCPFVKVHCASLPETILESELFGYEKGAFTGAGARKPGRFELAEGGTIFLDEIGDVSPAVQVKLLRIVQDREYERLGGTDVLRADVRIITATHRNLERMVKNGEFRQDLYYRLNVLKITVPPLRARPSDVERLALQFCARFASANGRRVRLGRDALDALQNAPWPGNVRQLQNVIERLVVLSDGDVVGAEDVKRELERDAFAAQDEGTEMSAIELGAAIRKAERRALKRALERSGGNRALAARLLGVSRRTLFYKLREHAIG